MYAPREVCHAMTASRESRCGIGCLFNRQYVARCHGTRPRAVVQPHVTARDHVSARVSLAACRPRMDGSMWRLSLMGQWP